MGSDSKTNQTNLTIAQGNMSLQKQKMAQDLAIQQENWAREDTSYQRTVSDMRAAGLSPLAMQGTNGSGEIVSTEAPQLNYQAQNSHYMTLSDKLQAISGSFSSFANGLSQFQSLQQQQAQTDLIRAQVENQRIRNSFDLSVLPHNLRSAKYGSYSSQYNAYGAKQDWLYRAANGMPMGTSDKERIARILSPSGQWTGTYGSDGLPEFNDSHFNASSIRETLDEALKNGSQEAQDKINELTAAWRDYQNENVSPIVKGLRNIDTKRIEWDLNLYEKVYKNSPFYLIPSVKKDIDETISRYKEELARRKR